MAGMAAPLKYSDGHVAVARRLLGQEARGMTYVTDLAKLLQVSVDTIWSWTLQHPDFREAVDEGFADPVDLAEASLFRRAHGYTYRAERIDVVKMRDLVGRTSEGAPMYEERIEVVRTPYLEHVPPDVKANEFILRNCRGDRWKDRRALEVTGKDGGPIEHIHAGAVDRLIGMLSERRAKMIDVTPQDADQGQLQPTDAPGA